MATYVTYQCIHCQHHRDEKSARCPKCDKFGYDEILVYAKPGGELERRFISAEQKTSIEKLAAWNAKVEGKRP